MASQVVLAHVHVVSHGMLELFKRVFVLLAASALLGDVEWGWHNAFGAALATLGTVLYFYWTPAHSGQQGHSSAAARKLRPHEDGTKVLNSQSPATRRAGHAPAVEMPGVPSGGGVAAASAASKHGEQLQQAAAARRLWAYGLVAAVLLLSPLQFMSGVGPAAFISR